MYLLKYIDARLILTAGFTLVAIACLMNAQLSSAWSGANFWLSQAVMAVGLALAFNSMVGAIVLEVINTGALSRPIDILTFAGYFQTVRLFGGEAGSSLHTAFSIGARTISLQHSGPRRSSWGTCYEPALAWSERSHGGQVIRTRRCNRTGRGDSRFASAATGLHSRHHRLFHADRLVGGLLPDCRGLHGARTDPI